MFNSNEDHGPVQIRSDARMHRTVTNMTSTFGSLQRVRSLVTGANGSFSSERIVDFMLYAQA